MKKIFLIGFKDLVVIFRDHSALLLMLLAPFALTLALGLVTGSASASGGGIRAIPVILVNQDSGQLGEALLQIFQSDELSDLLAPILLSDFAEAQARVDGDQAIAAVLIAAGFSDSIITYDGATLAQDVVQLQMYANPTSPTSASVVRAVLESFLSQVEARRVSGVVSIEQMIKNGRLEPNQVQSEIPALVAQITGNAAAEEAAAIRIVNQGSELSPNQTNEIDPLALMAPGMALMFLMYTVTYGGRTLLAERREGTLPRLFVSPTHTAQILAGKVLGIFLTGVAQMLILIVATQQLFRLSWGDPVAVLALVLCAVAGATGWGLLVAAVSKTTGQVSSIGSALMLIFGLLGGSFFSIDALPGWIQTLARVSPNAWGMEGFTSLALGGGLPAIVTPLAGLLAMAAILFVVAVLLIRRRGFITP